ncbi:MAG: hypothetical protein M3R55_12345 [Acidobacteriota bacterium]|nr:hypothetical protein [Acidobacteriota bacterium]
MALIAALLLALVLSTAVGGISVVGAIERRAAAAHRTAAQLRLAADGALALAEVELRGAGWELLLEGAGLPRWQRPVTRAPGIGALTAAMQRETILAGSHGADTPLWQVLGHTPWAGVAGGPARPDIVMWVADDWAEADGNPRRDTNSTLLVRVMAADGAAASWLEAVVRRGSNGAVRRGHTRRW